MDDQRKREEGQEKLNLDKSKQLMGQDQFDEKLEQNEDLAELRAETSHWLNNKCLIRLRSILIE